MPDRYRGEKIVNTIGKPNRLLSAALRIEETAGMLFMFLTFAVVLTSIVGRFVFNHPFVWSEELPAIFILWSVYCMLGVNYQNHDFLKIDLITDRAPAGVKKVLHLISEIVTAVIAVLVVFFGIVAFKTNFVSKVMSLDISVALTNYLPVIIGAGSILFFMILRIVARAKGGGQ